MGESDDRISKILANKMEPRGRDPKYERLDNQIIAALDEYEVEILLYYLILFRYLRKTLMLIMQILMNLHCIFLIDFRIFYWKWIPKE